LAAKRRFGVEVIYPCEHPANDAWSWLELVADAVVIVDADSTIVFANSRAITMFGYSAAELLGKPLDILIPVEHRHHHRAAQAEFNGSPQTREMGTGLNIHGIRKDGSRVPLDIHLQPGGSGGLTLASIRSRSAQLGTESPYAYRPDRESEARALLDLIVQRLYGIALTLRTVCPDTREGGARLDRSSDLIDNTIELIRTTGLESGVQSDALVRSQEEFVRSFRR
jgi:PAS domain S-box-containing protein